MVSDIPNSTLASVLAIDGGDLGLGDGLLAIIRPALTAIGPNSTVTILSDASSLRNDLPRWCRTEHHRYLERQMTPDGRDIHVVERGPLGVPLGAAESGFYLAPRNESRYRTADMTTAVPLSPTPGPNIGFSPRGAQVEPGGPSATFPLSQRDNLAPPETAALYDLAVTSQWDAGRDIPWAKVGNLPSTLERAVGQVMTFLAENELAALYVPARFLPKIHPHYAEVAMLLASQLNDEARHVDVFLKRARAGGQGVGVSSAGSAQSLLSLLDPSDFSEAMFLLSVMGEGTFIDLLRYIEQFAPDETTAEIARRARADEARHVHFGMAHIRYALAADPMLYQRLEKAVFHRAATLHQLDSVPAPIQDALTVLAAGGTDPKSIRSGAEHFRQLRHTMFENRIKRLQNIGFSLEQSEVLSGKHTANFM